MKTICKKDYCHNGIFIDLDASYEPYDNLLCNHNKYLDKNKKYYIYCQKGYKSKKVARVLEAYGYDITLVIN